MVVPLLKTGTRTPPKKQPAFNVPVTPSTASIANTKQHIALLALRQETLQQHRDALEASLAACHPPDVAKVVIEGYPPPKSYR